MTQHALVFLVDWMKKFLDEEKYLKLLCDSAKLSFAYVYTFAISNANF